MWSLLFLMGGWDFIFCLMCFSLCGRFVVDNLDDELAMAARSGSSLSALSLLDCNSSIISSCYSRHVYVFNLCGLLLLAVYLMCFLIYLLVSWSFLSCSSEYAK